MLIGRDATLRILEARLEDGEPLLTLHGPPGVGKSAVLRALRAEDRLWVSLEGAHDPAGVDRALAAALGLGGTGPLDEHLARALSARSLGAILIDEVEDAVEALRDRLPRWLAASSTCSFVVASQIALQIQQERRVPVLPLDAEDATALFASRLERLGVPRPDPALEATIVRRLDGLPLAIELAASRAAALPARDLLALLDDRLAALSSPRDGRSLAVALDAAFTLLAPEVAQTLARLALFGANVDLPLARIACRDQTTAEAHLHELWERSLLLREPDGFRLLAAVRERALRACEGLEAVRAELASGLAERSWDLAEPPWGPRSPRAFDALSRLRPALEASLHWPELSDRVRARLLVALAALDETCLPAAERRRLLERIPIEVDDDPVAADAYAVALARARLAEADHAGARSALHAGALGSRATELTPADLTPADRGDLGGSATRALVIASATVLAQGDAGPAIERAWSSADSAPERERHRVRVEAAYLRFHLDAAPEPARAALDESLRALRVLDDVPGVARAGTLRGLLALDTGELVQACRFFEEVLAVSAPLGSHASLRLAEHGLALALQELGDHDRAAEHYARALRHALDAGTTRAASYVEGFVATLELERGRLDNALRRARSAVSSLQKLGDLRYADLFEALVALLEKREAAPDRAKRDAGERAARELLAAFARTRTTGGDLRQTRDEARAAHANANDWTLRFALRVPEAFARARSDDSRSLQWEGSRVRVDEGAWIDLSRRPALRRLLDALVAAGGEHVSRDALFGAGWPDESNIEPTSAAQRVHTAVRRLRQLGLGDALASDREGYWIDRPITGGSPRR